MKFVGLKTAGRQEEALLNQRALLHSLLGGGELEASSLPSLPRPLIDMIADYNELLHWKLGFARPFHHGAIKRVADLSALHTGPYDSYAHTTGDTPLSSDVHAWRVTVEGLLDNGTSAYFGVTLAQEPRTFSHTRPSFHGVQTLHRGLRFCAGKSSLDSGLGEIRSGDTLDFLLDVDAAILTVITMKDGKRCVFELPRNMAWLPHFVLCRAGNSISVEVLPPHEAGQKKR